MDVIDLLTADHNRFRGTITRFKEAQEAEDTATMTACAEELFTDLDVHTKVEETQFYPPVREASEELAEIVDEGEQEHHVADMLVEELRSMEPGTDEWIAKVAVLIENVEHHLTEEEEEMFPQTRSALSSEKLEQMGAAVERQKAELGAFTAKDNMDHTKAELDQMARDQQIPGRSKMTHDELAATVHP